MEMAPVKINVNSLELPKGDLCNGGTLIVKEDNVIYHGSNKIHSDVPKVKDVRDIARDAARTRSCWIGWGGNVGSHECHSCNAIDFLTSLDPPG